MKKKNLFFAIVFAFSFVLPLAGQNISMDKRSEYIVYAISASPEGKFNPLIENTQYDEYVNRLVYASLLKLNSKIELEPSLAENIALVKMERCLLSP
ncbi:MAG: hypothetical protein ACTTKH_07060 [Treponema sp.]